MTERLARAASRRPRRVLAAWAVTIVLALVAIAALLPGALTSEQRTNLETSIGSLEGVSKVTQTSRPYKLASLEFHPQKTVVEVKNNATGTTIFVELVIAQPIRSRSSAWST